MEKLKNTWRKLVLDYNQFMTGGFHDQQKSIYQIARDQGYYAIKHKYYTDDGYINTVFRIVSKEDATQFFQQNKHLQKIDNYKLFVGDQQQYDDQSQIINLQKPVFICQHGFLDSCLTFMMNQKDSLAFRLVDAGYDVWLNNSRGNVFSKEHQFLDIKFLNEDLKNTVINPNIKRQRDQYWNFSFNEMGCYDQPALWKYVMTQTKQDKINYMGHSQGTTQMFVALMGHTEFFKKHMQIFVAIAPVMQMKYITADFAELFKYNKKTMDIVKAMGPELLPQPASIHPFLSNVHSVLESSQHASVKYACDEDPETTSSIALVNYYAHFPAGTSYKSFNHFVQLYDQMDFKMYDYENEEKNMKMYGGSTTPPLYPKERLRDFKIVMLCGKTDRLATPKDYLYLKKLLESQNCLAAFKETELGHIGLLNPIKEKEEHLLWLINDFLKREVMDQFQRE